MKKRIVGLETEYAIRYSSFISEKQDNRVLYDLIIKVIPSFVKIADGTSILKWKQIFLENGSAFCYESLPHHIDSGLLEAATPECTSPLELILYQRSIDKLLQQTLEKLNQNQSRLFSKSTISLIKNCKDAYDNIYGAQENYSGLIAKGSFLFFYRLFLVFYLPLLALYIFFVFIASFFILFFQSVLMIFFYIFYLIYVAWFRERNHKFNSYEVFFYPNHKSFFYHFERLSGIALTFTEIILSFPLIVPYVFVLKYFTFREYKKHLLAFIITRILFTGSGSINNRGMFYLSEKTMFTKRVSRTSNFPADRCIYDSGNLMKLTYLSVLFLFRFEFHYLKELFNKVQRFQIGMSDSCMCQVSELLKVGPLYLLMDMIDEGFLKETPQIRFPIKALKTINQYPNYRTAKLEIKNYKKLKLPSSLTALEIQYWYLNQTKEYLKQKTIVEPEYHLIVQEWEHTLNFLKEEPEKLFGKIDWITKRILINQTLIKEKNLKSNNNVLDIDGITQEDYLKHYELLKVIDIKYHDLYEGYYYELEKANLTKRFFSEQEIEYAIKNPPKSSEHAKIRSSIIKRMHQSYENIQISWNYVKIGSGAISKIIQLEDFKKRRIDT
jgi:Ca2+/Na+ antiporter